MKYNKKLIVKALTEYAHGDRLLAIGLIDHLVTDHSVPLDRIIKSLVINYKLPKMTAIKLVCDTEQYLIN
jgi:hypothetical protein